MSEKSGNLSINSENIFPIIKKWLYSDHDIFYRELVSNGCDAVTKLKKLELMGEYTRPEDLEYKIQIDVNPDEKTITVTDNGIGMTAEEVEEYINQIAFSGAQDFLEKYKDKANEDQIIGHFGLGFYSSFMVADKVTIDTLSYKEGATAVHWESEGGLTFAMKDGDHAAQGTSITLYLNEDSYEFSNEYRAREVLEKYCSFMPIPIFLTNVKAEPQYDTIDKEELTEKDTIIETVLEPAKTEEKENENGEKETVEVEPAKERYKILRRPVPLNNTSPLWNKHPNECTEEEYREFYRKVFMDFKEPLFWIHLNMDYPFNLKGILYFPKINTEYDSIEGTIKLYNNQVFIADNIKEVIPEFLMLLKGVIDCPDLPLNVSRSALQNDGFVKKISDYITKKVADKLTGMCKTDRENYEKYWDDIAPFIKFGCLKDDKFCEKMNDYILFKNIDGKYLTLKDCLEENKEKHENTVFYVTDEKEQSQYINMFRKEGLDAVILPHNIDSPFISHLEQKNENLKFLRIDADLNDTFKEEVSEDDETFKENSEKLTDIFKKALNNDKLTIRVEKLKDDEIASMLTVSEENRRMQDMMKMYNMYGMDPSMFGGAGETLVLNANHKLVQYVLEHGEGENTAKFCEQLYDLALLAHGSLTPERMTAFITRSNELMMILAVA
ncbi:MAG: molecular chaperone HtpG [Clostridiales bacterium]|nr:molecular chaperone HtpG [Clostridiales bacterium]